MPLRRPRRGFAALALLSALAACLIAPAGTGAAQRESAFRVHMKVSKGRVPLEGRVRVLGRVEPRAPGAMVLLKERTSGRWSTLGRRRLSRRSTFAIPYRPRTPGRHLLRVVKPSSAGRKGGRSRARLVIALAQLTKRSRGRAMTLQLGRLRVHAPKGAIGRGQTLTIRAGGEPGFAGPGARSLIGGPYSISTSQGQPYLPVTVSATYDAGLLAGGEQPLLMHGWSALQQWIPEQTTNDASQHTATAQLDSFSPLDLVGDLSWLAGTLTGNRTDLPGNCGEVPPWIHGVFMPRERNDSLPACIANTTNAGALKINIVNNRGYAQLITVDGARLDVNQSRWSDSVEGTVANELARRAGSRRGGSFFLAPGSSATIALQRPFDLIGQQAVSIRGAPQGGSAVAQMAWSFLKEARSRNIGVPVNVINCIAGVIYNAASSGAGQASSISGLRSCVDAATGVAEVAKSALRKLAGGVFVIDFFYKLIDLEADEAFPARITFSFRGKATTNPNIHIEGLDLGTITAGEVTVKQISASGGVPPYELAISTIPDNQGRAPDWVDVAGDGTVTIAPPADTNEYVSFYVFAADATGQRSATGVYEVTFQVVENTAAFLATVSPPSIDTYVYEDLSVQLSASGGQPPYKWSLDDEGFFTQHLILSEDGELSGFIEQVGVESVPLTIVDARGRTAHASLEIEVDFGIEPPIYGNVTRLTHGDASSRVLDISADGQTVLISSRASNLTPESDNREPDAEDLYEIDVPTGGIRRITNGSGNNVDGRLSADGSTVVFEMFGSPGPVVGADPDDEDDLDFYVWDEEDGFRRAGVAGQPRRMSISADGGAIAFTSSSPGDSKGHVWVLDTTDMSSEEIAMMPGDGYRYGHLDLSADGNHLAYSAQPENTNYVPFVHIRNLDDGSDRKLPIQTDGTIELFGDASQVVYGTYQGIFNEGLAIYDLDDGSQRILDDGLNGVFEAHMQSQGTCFAMGSFEEKGLTPELPNRGIYRFTTDLFVYDFASDSYGRVTNTFETPFGGGYAASAGCEWVAMDLAPNSLDPDDPALEPSDVYITHFE